MPEKKKMFKELHERWKDMDLPEEQKDVLEKIERDISGIPAAKELNKIILKLRHDLNNTDLWFKLGSSLSELKHYDFALASLNITEKLDTHKKYVAGVKGFVLVKLGRNDEARTSLSKAVEQTGFVTGYSSIDDLISGIESGSVELKAFRTPESGVIDKGLADIDRELDGLIIGDHEPPSRTDLESELEALSDELDKILGSPEEEVEVIEVFKCPECGTEIGSEADVCPNCGTEFAEMDEVPDALEGEEVAETYECPECGNTIGATATSCPRCGTVFEEEIELFTCPACGEDVEASATACPSCGAEFITEVEELEGELDEFLERELIKETEPGKAGVVKAVPAVGLTNGLRGMRKDKTGLTNGRPEQKMRMKLGVTNGVTNGLTNGLRALRVGITNGLTNGNGITNGLGPKSSLLEPKRSKMKMIVVPLIVLALVFSPYLFNRITPSQSEISIDGKFGDWLEVPMGTDSAEAARFNPNVDIVDYRLDSRRVDLSFYIKVEGQMMAGEDDGRHVDTVCIFIDSDQNPETGYIVRGIGADYMLQTYGWKGDVLRNSRFSYTSSSQGWENWERLNGGMSSAAEGSELEVKVPYSHLFIGRHVKIDVLFYMQSWDGFEDFSDTVISNQEGVVAVTQKGVGNAQIFGNNNQLLRMEVEAKYIPVTLTSIEFTRTGVGSNSDVSAVRLMDGASIIGYADLRDGAAEVSTNLRLTVGTERTLFLVVDVQGSPSGGSGIGFTIQNNHDIAVSKGTVSLRREAPDAGKYEVSYLSGVPNNITIDGAFADWQGKNIGNDTSDDDDIRDDIDILKYGVSNMTDGTAFFVQVAGEIAGGVEVPFRNSAVAPEHIVRGEGVTGTGQEKPIVRAVGADVVQIYIDTEYGTGYRVGSSAVFANYLIEIKGRHNTILSSEFLEWSGSYPGDWSWTALASVAAGLETERLETGISWELLGIDPDAESFRVYFMTTDWKKAERDYSDDVISGPTRSDSGHGRYSGYDLIHEAGYSVYLDDDSGGVLFETGDGFYLSWILPGELKWGDASGMTVDVAALESSALEVENNRALWPDVYPGTSVSVEYLFEERLLKENIILEERLLAPDSLGDESYLLLEMPVEFNPDLLILTDGFDTDQGWLTSDDMSFMHNKRVVYTIKAPVAVDAGGDTLTCEYLLLEGETKTLTLRCPSEWLDNAAYPLKIDPGVSTFTLESGNATANSDNFGDSVAIGDFNGDNRADVLVGAKNSDNNATDGGCAYIFFGPISGYDNTPDVTLSPATAIWEFYGISVGVGDFNNDSYDDAVVAGTGSDIAIKYGNSSLSGTYYRADMDVLVPALGGVVYSNDSIESGDFNTAIDGNDDLVLAAETTNGGGDNGEVYIYYFNSTDWSDGTVDNGPDETLQSEWNTADSRGLFGNSMAVGNFYSSTNDDLVVGEPGYHSPGGPYSSEGRINIFDGASIYNNAGPHTYDNVRNSPADIDHSISGERFGYSVAAGDFNSNSTIWDFDDIIVGAPSNPNDAGGDDDAGRAYVVEAEDIFPGGFPSNDGSFTTDIPNPDGTSPAGDNFGNAVAAGDFYGDGFVDFFIGAYLNDSGKGSLMIYDYDGSTSIPTVPTETVNGTQNGEHLGYSIAAGNCSGDPVFIIASGANFYDNATYTDYGRVWIIQVPEFPVYEVPVVVSFMMTVAIFWRKKRKK